LSAVFSVVAENDSLDGVSMSTPRPRLLVVDAVLIGQVLTISGMRQAQNREHTDRSAGGVREEVWR
jgi:hypothetical protein